MKRILGLDLGTNSIGWALVDTDENGNPVSIYKSGSRVIPMSQDILGDFDRGNSVSQTAERTTYRGTRRLRERHLLRRERLHRVLHLMGFLPVHYEESIGWDKEDNPTFAKFLTDTEPKLPWHKNTEGEYEFLFKESYDEMLADFKKNQPQLFRVRKNGQESLIPYDWTIYYLRKKALSQPIRKEELAWLILNFNQKRGYYQLRGEEEEENPDKLEEYHALTVIKVTADEPQKGKLEIWYNVELENGWIYRRTSKTPLVDWEGKKKEFIVTTGLNKDGTPKTDKDGILKRSFRMPSTDDWMLVKKKIENDIEKSEKTVGCYIYETILQNPNQKIRGKLIRTIERKFYKKELTDILNKQMEFHPELESTELLQECAKELYPQNEAHRSNLLKADFTGLFVNDIIFHQRPLKSKKSLISNCPYEYHTFYHNGERQINPLKCIAKSNPLFQEFRLWQFIYNLRILEREKQVNGKMEIDVDVTSEFLPTPESYVELFEYLNEVKEIEQDTLLKKHFNKKKVNGKDEKLPYRWNYVENKKYPCNETHAQITARLKKCNIPNSFLTNEKEMELWHILYSVDDKSELEKALGSFKRKYDLTESFVKEFQKFPSFEKEYGSYSEKAIKKLLSLMRMGKYWDENAIDENTILRIQSISKRLEEINHDAQNIRKVSDDDIPERVLKSFLNVKNLYSGLNTYQACYAIYGRHSESLDIRKWETPDDIELFLKQFKQHSLHNPIVEQVVTETLRVVKDIWSTYGEISEIHIELGRSMKHTAAERARRSTQNSENENTNLRIKYLLMELQNDSSVENVRPYSPNQQEILKLYEEGALLSADELPDDILKISKMNHPSQSELTRYRLWLEQQYRSPYTGEIIPLSKLFTPAYEIEHVIPQSRYFDDSLSNKVICESEVNKLKGNLLGYEFIKKHESEYVPLSFGKSVRVFSTAEYEEFIKKHYKGNRGKITKLLLDEIPTSFIERQLNDTRYISKLIKGLLSNIVREKDEQEATSKNVIPCSGGITTALKKDWGLTDSWNRIIQPRFMRLNELSNSSNFGEWKNNHFQIQIPIELQKGFNKKRIDHRHHALDAVIIACATRNHINYLNNESARESKEEGLRYDLKNKLCSKINTDDKGNHQWRFNKPWDTFTQDVQDSLEKIVVSFKQNLRVINKTVNKYQVYEDGKKIIKSQEKGDSWAIRKPLHKETIFANVALREIKTVRLSVALNDWENIVDKKLKKEIKKLISKYGKFDVENINKYFKDRKYIFEKKDISKVAIYYFEEGNTATRKSLDESFDKKNIESITDTGIQKILKKHLAANDNKPDIAFSPEGIEDMNQRLTELNNGKPHQPIYKVRKYEQSKRYPLGTTGNKKKKYVEAEKGTNLFYAIYQSNDGERIYETIPLNVVIERQKQRLPPVQEDMTDKNKSYRLLFWLSPNDLVYVPTEEERENPHLVDLTNPTKEQVKRIYKFVSCTNHQGFFVPNTYASPIISKRRTDRTDKTVSLASSIIENEIGANNKSERMINYADKSVIYDGDKPVLIKSCCWKLTTDRLGNILKYIR